MYGAPIVRLGGNGKFTVQDIENHRSGEEANHPTDEARPKPVSRLTEVIEQGSVAHSGEEESQDFLNTIFDQEVEVNVGHGKSC